MMPDDMPFTPEQVDEQIDRSSQGAALSSPKQQLVSDLQALFASDAEALSGVVARGRERLVQQSSAPYSPPQHHSDTSAPAHTSSERPNAMKALIHPFPQQSPWHSRITGLAAALLLVVLVGGLVAGLVLVRLGKTTTIGQTQTSLKGGLEITFQASCDVPSQHCTTNELRLLSADSAALKGRIADGLGIAQPTVQQQGNDEIIVKLPTQVRTQDALALLTPTGKLEFLDTGPTELALGTVAPEGKYPVRFTGEQLDPNSVHATLDPQSGQPVILFQFRSQYQTAFANYTQQNIGNYLTMTLDGKVIESAVIQGQITGPAQIVGGSYTLADAQETAALMRGSLPLPLTIISKQTITT